MPNTKKRAMVVAQAGKPQIPQAYLDELIPAPITSEQLEDIFAQFKKSFIEQALGAEMAHHLGYAAGQIKPAGATNQRNGRSSKTVLTDGGAVQIDIPRDRESSFEPQLIGKHERRLTGFDDKIISMYARGMTVREIQGHLREMYAIDVSPDLISSATDAVVADVKARGRSAPWRACTLW